MRYTRFTNCDLVDEGRFYRQKDLLVDNDTGKIVERVEDASELSDHDVKVVDLGGFVVAPGFLDIQINGMYGMDFASLDPNGSEEDYRTFQRRYRDVMAKFLQTGTTSICPTVTSSFPNVYNKVLSIYKKSRNTHEIDSLGAHVEGPFIDLEKKGCHPTETFRKADDGYETLCQVYGRENLDHYVSIVTAAPEVPGVLQAIPELIKRNIVFSIGHTNSDHSTGLKAVELGASMLTHLYNAMPQPHHREVGTVGLVSSPLPANSPYYGVICDGVHVDASMATLAYKNNPDKCILVTDAISLIGLPDGVYKWGKRFTRKAGARCFLDGTDTLAGSASTLTLCVRNLMNWASLTLAEAVKTVTNNPARSLGVEQQKGYLRPGCDADLVVLDHRGYLQQVYKLGNLIEAVDDHRPTVVSAAL